VARIEHLPKRWARPIRWTAAVVALAAVALLPRVRFDYNLLALRDPTTESVSTFEELLSREQTSPWTIDVVAPDLGQARALAARIATLPAVARTRTLADWVPAEQDEKRETLGTAAYFVPAVFADSPSPPAPAQRAALQALAEAAGRAAVGSGALAPHARRLHDALAAFLRGPGADGTRPDAFERLGRNVVGSLPQQVRELTPLLAPERVAIDDLPGELREQMVAPDGQARMEVFAREDVSDSAALERFVDGVRAVAPDATGPAVWLVEWGRVTWRAMLSALFGGIAIMLLFLVLLWHSIWDPLLAFFPLLLAALLTCATLALLGQPFNFANVIVLPMLIGMGVDNGVHLVHRHRTNPDEEDVLATSTARAVFYAAVTTILSFGSLAFASHGGMAAIGTLLTIGVAWTLVCYVVVLPAVLAWDDRRRRHAS
jgi:hopanoid biosynthesis associated RND transporter like protein HpnN